jgi:hypothetical protein
MLDALNEEGTIVRAQTADGPKFRLSHPDAF